MKEFLKTIRADFLLSSLFCVALGVTFIIWKDGVLSIMGSVFAIALILIGAIYMCSFFLNVVSNGLSVVMGIVVLAVGIWFLIQPSVIVSLIPIAIGVLLLFHGIRALKETFEAKKNGYGSWTVNMVLALISLVCGVICIFDSFGVMEKAIVVVGVILVYNGLSDIWIASRATKAAKDYARRHATVDVEFVDDGDGK